MPLTQLQHRACQSRRHCQTCRTNPTQRHSINMPEKCPQGITAKATLQIVQFPKNAKKICANCPDSRSCPNVTICCGGQVSVNIVVPCLRDHW